MNIHNVEFIKSAAESKGLIGDELPQVVFAGRSNVGKSSVINRLLNRKNFARIGKTPGKTIHINYFLLDKTAYLVDLPGYGYAKAAKTEHGRWGKLMGAYFADARHIALGIMIVDARHKPTVDDCTMAAWFKSTLCPLVIVANKVDKVKKSEIDGNLALIRKTLELDAQVKIIAFSAEKGTNREDLLEEIETAIKSWYN